MYSGCKDPSCVDMERVRNKGPEKLAEAGTPTRFHGRPGWLFPADPSNYAAASRTWRDIDTIVIHTAEGYTGGLTSFQDPGRGGSAHYAVQWNGEVARMVPDEDVAWHAGNSRVNAQSIGIEHVGFAYAMQPGTVTEWSRPMLRSSAKLVAALARKYGVPLDRDHIIAHDDVPNQSHTDPGPYWPWGRYMAQVKWYYYRPWILGGAGVLAIAGLLRWQIGRRRKA